MACLAISLLSVNADEIVHHKDLSKLHNLSETQKQKIEQIRSKNHPQIQSLKEQLSNSRIKLEAISKDTSTPEEEIESLNQKIYSLQSSLSDLRVRNWSEIKSILSPEQKEQLRTIQFSH